MTHPQAMSGWLQASRLLNLDLCSRFLHLRHCRWLHPRHQSHGVRLAAKKRSPRCMRAERSGPTGHRSRPWSSPAVGAGLVDVDRQPPQQPRVHQSIPGGSLARDGDGLNAAAVCPHTGACQADWRQSKSNSVNQRHTASERPVPSSYHRRRRRR